MSRKLGKRQLQTLLLLSRPNLARVAMDSEREIWSLVDRGLLQRVRGGGLVSITPAGLRALADALESGALEPVYKMSHEAFLYIDIGCLPEKSA